MNIYADLKEDSYLPIAGIDDYIIVDWRDSCITFWLDAVTVIPAPAEELLDPVTWFREIYPEYYYRPLAYGVVNKSLFFYTEEYLKSINYNSTVLSWCFSTTVKEEDYNLL